MFLKRSPLVLMPWMLPSTGQQQAHYWLCVINGNLFAIGSAICNICILSNETKCKYNFVFHKKKWHYRCWGHQELRDSLIKVIRARFLSLPRSKLRLCSTNHRPGYWSNLPSDWLSTTWAYSEHEIENGPWNSQRSSSYWQQGSQMTLWFLALTKSIAFGMVFSPFHISAF